MTFNGITPERLLSLERRIAQLESRDDRYRVRAVASQPRPQTRWAKTTTPYGVDYPATGNTFPFIFIERTYTEEAGFQVVTNTNLGDLDAPEHFLNSNRYIDEGDIVPVFEVDGQWWEFDETTEGGNAKLIQLDMAKAAYEQLASGTITTYLPAGTGYELTRNESTGEVTVGATTVDIVNAAPRVYKGANSSRSRVVVAVPIGGNKYVPIPNATDPFLDCVWCEWRMKAGATAIVNAAEPDPTNAADFDLLGGNTGTSPTTSEYWPHYARLENNKVYLPYPGYYWLVLVGAPYVVDIGSPFVKTRTTSSAAGHTHTVDVEYNQLIQTQMRPTFGTGVNTEAAYWARAVSPLGGITATTQWTLDIPTLTWSGAIYVEDDEAIDAKYFYPQFSPEFYQYTGSSPSCKVDFYAMIVPLTRDWRREVSDGKAEWKHNAYADGSFKWWGTGTEPS